MRWVPWLPLLTAQRYFLSGHKKKDPWVLKTDWTEEYKVELYETEYSRGHAFTEIFGDLGEKLIKPRPNCPKWNKELLPKMRYNSIWYWHKDRNITYYWLKSITGKYFATADLADCSNNAYFNNLWATVCPYLSRDKNHTVSQQPCHTHSFQARYQLLIQPTFSRITNTTWHYFDGILLWIDCFQSFI